MYLPIMKNRNEELRVISNMNNFFSDSLIPIIEIIRDEYDVRYKTDENTGKYIYEEQISGKRRKKVKLETTDEDIITLKNIEQRLNGKKGFIDFFRFNEEEYDNKVFKGIELSFKLSRNFNYYKERLLQINEFENLYPIISIKEGFEISESVLKVLVSELKKNNHSIAIRITDAYLESYAEFIEEYLTENDFVMLDIRNQDVDSKFIELEEFQELDTHAAKILLNSPRSRKYKNGDYEDCKFTAKIKNKVATIYTEYDFDGFGDFGGLKDDLPTGNRGNGTGAALGLIYLKEKNAFYSIVNYNTKMGMKGFEIVRNKLINKLDILDCDGNCITIKKIENMSGKYGNWGTWSNLTLTRYIQQQAKEYK